MSIFHKRKSKKEDKAKQRKKSRKQNTRIRVAEREQFFPDVKVSLILPALFFLGVLLMVIGFGDLGWQNHEYKVAQSRLSMPKGTQLPLLKGKEKGKLTLGNTILSKDHKHMAVSISYNDDAHKYLSSFGRKYKLWLVAPNGYPVKDIHLKYGFFGTDGNGVLQISSDKPFKNQAFVVIIIDNGHLVTADQLSAGDDGAMTDDEINQSITAQLATGNIDPNADSESSGIGSNTSKKAGVPMYYVRLNPHSAHELNINWDNNERVLVDHLFVNQNTSKIYHKIQRLKQKRTDAKNSLDEFNARLKENPQDQTAAEQKDYLENVINGYNNTIKTQQNQYDRLSKARFNNHILGQQQTHHHTLTTSNLSYFGNEGTQ